MDDHVDSGIDQAAEDRLDRLDPVQAAALNELLMVGVRELDAGLGVQINLEDFLAEGRARRAARALAAE